MSDRKAVLEAELVRLNQKYYDAQFIDSYTRMKEERHAIQKRIDSAEAELKELSRDGSE